MTLVARALIALALCVACSKPDANAHKARARELASTYGPKLEAFAQHAIDAHVRVDKLDTTLPGAAPLTSLEQDHQTALLAARTLVDELPARHTQMDAAAGEQDIRVAAAKLKQYVDELAAIEREQDALLATLEGLPGSAHTGSAK